MFKELKRAQTGLMGAIALFAMVGCSSGLDTLGGVSSAVRAHIHMSEASDYESVDDERLQIDLGKIYLGQKQRAWFMIQSIGNAPVLIESISFAGTQGDGWGKPELKITEAGGDLTPPHTLEARDQYLVEVSVTPMVAGQLSAEVQVVMPGMETVRLSVVGRAVDTSTPQVLPGRVVSDSVPGVIEIPEIEVWPEEPTEEPEIDEAIEEPGPVTEDEPEVVEEEADQGDEGVDINEAVPAQIDIPEEDEEPELEIDEEPIPEEDNEPETLIGGNLLAEDEGEDVIVTCVSKGGGYTHQLYLDNTNTFICDSADVGTQVNLGTFPAGTELIFRLDVLNSGYSYYTGAAERNPDSEIHVRIDSTESGAYRFGFEDLYGGGDHDYDDCVFEVSGSDADWLEE